MVNAQKIAKLKKVNGYLTKLLIIIDALTPNLYIRKKLNVFGPYLDQINLTFCLYTSPKKAFVLSSMDLVKSMYLVKVMSLK